MELDMFRRREVGGDAESPEELQRYKCPLVLKVCPAEASDGITCKTEKRIAVCGATVYDPEASDGTGMRLKPMIELGWKYCVSDDYKQCPYYKWYKLIEKYMK